MPSLSDVRTYAGVPPAGAFAATDGTPIVIDTTTDHGYYLAKGDVVKPLGASLLAAAFSDTTTQSQTVINTAKTVTWNTTLGGAGIALGTPTSRVVVPYPGLYVFQFSLELSSGSASAKNIWVWARKNGVDVANSARKASLSGSGVTMQFGLSFPQIMAANDYFELAWAVDDIGLTISQIAAPSFGPAAPSALLVAYQLT